MLCKCEHNNFKPISNSFSLRRKPLRKTGRNMAQLQEADKFLDDYDGDQAYEVLLEQEPDNVENLWRIAHACYIKANQEEENNKRVLLLKEGRSYCLQALEKEPDNGVVLKWAATLTGVLAEHSSNKEKIALGHEFKNFLDKALDLLPSEPTLLHMRGRFRFQVASLSLMERGLASVLFQKLPTASYAEALEDMLKMEEVVSGDLDNYLYIGKCYHAMGQKVEAKEWLQKLADAVAVDSVDAEHISEAKQLLTQL